eukprot:903809-Pyramimonas_sp.AAC.1
MQRSCEASGWATSNVFPCQASLFQPVAVVSLWVPRSPARTFPTRWFGSLGPGMSTAWFLRMESRSGL